MNRRNFLKQVVATATVGAVAPKLLAEPVTMGADTAMAGASRVAINGGVYEVALDISNWTWNWLPISGIRIASPFTEEAMLAGAVYDPSKVFLVVDSESESAVT